MKVKYIKVKHVFAVLMMTVLPFFAIRATIEDLKESGGYPFTKASREAHRADMRRLESVSAYNKRIKRGWSTEEREYQQWKKQEDEYQLQRMKEESFRQRYEGRPPE